MKIASAGVLPALAIVAAVLLGGCGGGGSSPVSTQASTTATTAARDGGPSAEGKGSQPEDEGSGAAPGASSAAGTGSQGQQQSHKHGPHIVQPKGKREPAPTPAQIAHASVADLSLESPAIVAAAGHPGHLAATYTCDGKDSWPSLHWRGVPAGSAELVLFAMNIQPVEGEIFFDWAVAGIEPGLEGIEAGKLPSGAVVGRNSFGKRGYSICPSGAGEAYMLALYALPKRLGAKPGFDAHAFREEVLDASGDVGFLPAIYARS